MRKIRKNYKSYVIKCLEEITLIESEQIKIIEKMFSEPISQRGAKLKYILLKRLDNETFGQIAQDLGLTRERIRQLEARGVNLILEENNYIDFKIDNVVLQVHKMINRGNISGRLFRKSGKEPSFAITKKDDIIRIKYLKNIGYIEQII